MALTDTGWLRDIEREDGSMQREYMFPNGWGLSLINSPRAHGYRFAWEAAVLNPKGELDYSTELTSDVEVFMDDEEANEFIERAAQLFGGE